MSIKRLFNPNDERTLGGRGIGAPVTFEAERDLAQFQLFLRTLGATYGWLSSSASSIACFLRCHLVYSPIPVITANMVTPAPVKTDGNGGGPGRSIAR